MGVPRGSLGGTLSKSSVQCVRSARAPRFTGIPFNEGQQGLRQCLEECSLHAEFRSESFHDSFRGQEVRAHRKEVCIGCLWFFIQCNT